MTTINIRGQLVKQVPLIRYSIRTEIPEMVMGKRWACPVLWLVPGLMRASRFLRKPLEPPLLFGQDDTTQAMSLRDVGAGKGRRLQQVSDSPDEFGCQQIQVGFLDVRPVQLPYHSGNMLLLGPPDSTLEA